MRRGTLAEMVLAAAIGSLLGAGFVGAHGGDTAKLHGCYPTGGGPLELLGAAGDTCPAGYESIDWAANGPPGATGPKGPAGTLVGPAGAAGPAGGSGPPGAGYTTRVVRGEVGKNFAHCAKGERAVGGGYSVQENPYASFSIQWNQPLGTDRWIVDGHPLSQLRVSVVCARRRPDIVDLPMVPRP